MVPTERPIFFHYAQSIYSHRVLWYLWLRDIKYDECVSQCFVAVQSCMADPGRYNRQ